LNKAIKFMSTIHDKIEQERAQAREVCEVEGGTSGACAAAWDVVEELQAEAAHQRDKEPAKNSLQQYCDDNPDALECRVYDN
jgi:CP12 domain